MKKIYINPSMEVIKMHKITLLSESVTQDAFGGGSGSTSGSGVTTSDSRGFSFGDED